MSDEQETKQNQDGFLYGPSGKSSGRLVKLLAFIVMAIIGIGSTTMSVFALFAGKMDASTFVMLVLGLVTTFGSLVLGTEITARVTKQ
jgi:hypothetical protein